MRHGSIFIAAMLFFSTFIAHQRLPDLPRAIGGQMAGVSNGAIIVAGGSYFEGSLFEGGRKVWLDAILVLEPRGDRWISAGRLDHPLAYGAAAGIDDRVIMIGGSDGAKHFDQAVALHWNKGKLEKSPLPPLPQPLANMGAAAIGRTIYVACGQTSSTEAIKTLYSLDLDEREPGWKTLEPIHGVARILPAVAAQNGALFVMSGAELLTGGDGKAMRRYLKDGWRYVPGKGWSRIADLPRPATAAAAAPADGSRILVFGGDDGANAQRVFELREKHPGFSRDILAYQVDADRWTKAAEMPVSLVTTSAVNMKGSIVIPGGEDRPGNRSAMVIKLAIK
jgi:N-acetylneuraminic acid mutarotase